MSRQAEEQKLFYNIYLVANKLQIASEKILNDITLKQWFLLLVVSKLDAELSNISTTANLLGSTRQNIRIMAKSLEMKGYLKVEKSTKDKRELLLILQSKTYLYFNEFEKRGNIFLTDVFGALNYNQVIEMNAHYTSILKGLSADE